jgi:hypothetical protein
MTAQRAGGFMAVRCWLASLVAAALSCGCAGTPDNRRSDTVSFVLQAGPRNAGETGRGFMTARGDRTLINLTITGVPPWVVRPIKLFTFVYAGSCAKRNARPAYALNDTVQVNAQNGTSGSGPFTIAKTVPAPMATLRSGEYAIVLRTSPADGNWDIFCGDMKSL